MSDNVNENWRIATMNTLININWPFQNKYLTKFCIVYISYSFLYNIHPSMKKNSNKNYFSRVWNFKGRFTCFKMSQFCYHFFGVKYNYCLLYCLHHCLHISIAMCCMWISGVRNRIEKSEANLAKYQVWQKNGAHC